MERRRFRRLKTRIPLYGKALNAKQGFEGLVMNMSEGGFSFETLADLPLRSHYEFEIGTPEGYEPALKLQVAGQIRWCSPSQTEEGLHWVGVMFEPSRRTPIDVITKFVEENTLPEG